MLAEDLNHISVAPCGRIATFFVAAETALGDPFTDIQPGQDNPYDTLRRIVSDTDWQWYPEQCQTTDKGYYEVLRR